MNLFDPVKITSFTSLAAAAIWAICYAANKSKPVIVSVLILTLAALGSSAFLEWKDHVDPCADAPKLRLNEICAEGEQCDGGADFVEIFNPHHENVNLGCYAISDQRSTRRGERFRSNPLLLPGDETIEPGKVRAWDENELGFKISRKGDRVELLKVKLEPGQRIEFVRLDQVSVDNTASYQCRSPNGADNWLTIDHEHVRAAGKVGSFGKPNPGS